MTTMTTTSCPWGLNSEVEYYPGAWSQRFRGDSCYYCYYQPCCSYYYCYCCYYCSWCPRVFCSRWRGKQLHWGLWDPNEVRAESHSRRARDDRCWLAELP